MVSNGDLEQRLREDVSGLLGSRAGELREEIERLRGQLDDALARLSERLDSAARLDESTAAGLAGHLRAARQSGVEEAEAEYARSRESSDMAMLNAAVEEIGAQQTQAEILNALVNRAANFAPRLAFFVIKSERATGWRARGLEGTVGDDAVREISLPLSADTLLGETARTRRTWSGAPGTHAQDHEIYNRFGDEPPQRIVAVPLVARDKAVAVLYADSAGQDAEAVNLEAIEALVRVAGMSVELLALRRGGGTAAHEAGARAGGAITSAAPEQPRGESHEARAPEAAPAPATGSVAAAPAREGGAPLFVTTPAPEPAVGAQPPPFAPETFAPAAAQTDAVGQFSVTPPTPAPATPSASGRRADTSLPIEVSEEERPQHVRASRFARLLVSEIKLYNEQKVREGQQHGDLYRRLRDDIDRSRDMYDKRHGAEIGGRFDYFHHELVNQLAQGDPSRLGDGYPGAVA